MFEYGDKVANNGETSDGILSHSEDNVRFRELENACKTAGITLDDPNIGSVDENMLAQAMARYASGGVFGINTGTANALVINSVTDSFVLPKQLFDGMAVCFRPGTGQSNTSAVTLNYNGQGAKAVVDHSGAALVGSEFFESLCFLLYDEMNTRFVLVPWSNSKSFGTGGGGGGSYDKLPVYPEVTTNNSFLTVNIISAGTLEIATSQIILHRGSVEHDTASYSVSERQLTTVGNKTYHIRWSPTGKFKIKDLADSGYNPSSLNDNDPIFDSSYDDMLVAKVVTDGSNTATVTKLKNKHKLVVEAMVELINTGNDGQNTAYGQLILTYNWARTPDIKHFTWGRHQANENPSIYDKDYLTRDWATGHLGSPNMDGIDRYKIDQAVTNDGGNWSTGSDHYFVNFIA